MVTDKQNDVLTRTGPGTLMGDLFRRYWLPALHAWELPEPDCAPVRQVPADRVLLVGLGRERDFNETAYHSALLSAVKALKTTGASEATICLTDLPLKRRDMAWKVEHAVLAVCEGVYRFDRMKSKAPEAKRALRKVTLQVGKRGEIAAGESAVDRAQAIAEGITLAKELGNLPANICTPTYLAEQAQELGKRHGIRVEVLEKKDIEKLGMGCFLAVAQGSRQPPKLIVFEYQGGKRDAPPVALVGKGVTFDTGGISIKPAAEMDEMKFDMCGAASVFGADEGDRADAPAVERRRSRPGHREHAGRQRRSSPATS